MPLVTNLDGTQTFGLDALALFPKDSPTLTTPPFTEVEFPLYLKPRSDKYEDVYPAVVRSLRQPPTPLNGAFFSKPNLDALQDTLALRIREGLGLDISRQSDWEMLLLMRRVYMEAATNWPDDVAEEVARLNTLTLTLATEAVKANITKYLTYRSQATGPVALPSPADMLTAPPYETGTPAPLPDLNAEYELGHGQAMSTRPPAEVWATTPPREAR